MWGIRWFLDFSTRGKLFAGFGLMIAFLATVIMTAYLGISAIQALQKNLYQEDFANAVDLLHLRSDENATPLRRRCPVLQAHLPPDIVRRR